MSSIWVDKYKPKDTSDIIGQSRNIARIKSWLKSYEPQRSRPLFIYGPPGIGKTTAAHLCCKETGFKTIELNASDQRNKNIISHIISIAASNSRLNFFGRASETKDAIILDEIDGMGGNEDRGGIGQLIVEIKNTLKPMIFICNDGQHQKLRSLKDKCETIEFKKPDYEAIKSVVVKIARREGLNLEKINIKNLAESSNYDIRQIVNSLSLFREGSIDQISKTTNLTAFEATRKALTKSKDLIGDKFECFFSDYNIMPLFMFENYNKNRPLKGDHLKMISRAADSLCLSDLAEKEIRSNQNWSLLNVQGLFSTVLPSAYCATSSVGRIDFPQYLGKISNTNKRMRLLQELNAHMCLSLKGGLDCDYLEVLSRRLSDPLIKKEACGGIEAAVDFMYDYSLLRDDFNSIMELATWSFKPDPMLQVDSKTKTSFTMAYKKRSQALPYFSDDKVTKKRKPTSTNDEEVDEEEEEEEETVIKPKRVLKAPPPAKGKKEKEKKDKEVSDKKEKEKEKKQKEKEKKEQEKEVLDMQAKSKPDKRPIDGGIARFFTQKKQKT